MKQYYNIQTNYGYNFSVQSINILGAMSDALESVKLEEIISITLLR